MPPLGPHIRVEAPISGEYVLIEDDGTDTVITSARLEAGEAANFPILRLDGETRYHVQVHDGEAGAPGAIWETIPYRGQLTYLPMVAYE